MQSGIHMKTGAFDSDLCLKTSILTWVKYVSNTSARRFSSVVFMHCLCFNHLVSTLIPSEEGETGQAWQRSVQFTLRLYTQP